MGDGTFVIGLAPLTVEGLASTATAVGLGYQHTCAGLATGDIMCWGDNSSGQLGDGTEDDSATPRSVINLTGNGATVVCGWMHTCVMMTDGSVTCWGGNIFGQLGDGSTDNSPTPVAVSGLTSGVQDICGGLSHTCALKSDGSVLCWGDNDEGQLGTGDYVDSLVPLLVEEASPASAISCKWTQTCALTPGGDVKCWGSDMYGQVTGVSPGYPHPVVCE